MNCIASNQYSPRQVILNMGNAGSNIGGGGITFFPVFLFTNPHVWILGHSPAIKYGVPYAKLYLKLLSHGTEECLKHQNNRFSFKSLAGECQVDQCAPSSTPFALRSVHPTMSAKALSGIKIFYFEKLAKSLWSVLSLYHKFTDRIAALCAKISKDFRSV